MEILDFNLESKFDDLKLYGLIVKPKHIKAIVQLTHGMAERKERYLPFMKFLANQGYLCIIHDHRGHGKSVKNHHDLGYFYKGKAEAVIEDLLLVNQFIKQEYLNIPIYMFGHSMGSLAVRWYLKKYESTINGLIICGSPSRNPMTSIGLFIVKTLAKIKGNYYKNHLVDNIAIGSFNQPFKNENLQNAWLTTDTNIVDQYNKDPLCGFSFTMNGYETLFTLMKETYSKTNWNINQPSLPIYFISGKDDPCKTSDKDFYQSVYFLESLGYTNISSKLFNGMRHEILNELEKENVYHDILNKLNTWYDMSERS